MKPLVAVFLLSATLGCGEGGQVQPETADALRVRAEQGDADAQYNLGVKYFNGDGVPQDSAEAVRWYRLAVAQGHADAEAERLYRLAAEQGHAEAQVDLFRMYFEGLGGVAVDIAEAMRWYRLASEQGHADAQYNLGVSYARGEGIPQDDAQAHMWFNLAASRLTGEKRDSAVRNRVSSFSLSFVCGSAYSKRCRCAPVPPNLLIIRL